MNAYSRALALDDALPAVWSNRAACHLALGDHQAAAADCTHALDLLLARKDRWGALKGTGGLHSAPDAPTHRIPSVQSHAPSME